MTTNIKHEKENQVCVMHFTKEGTGLVLGKVAWARAMEVLHYIAFGISITGIL